MNKKLELIEELYKNKRITVEEFIILSGNEKIEPSSLEELANYVTNICFQDFAVDNIVKYMYERDWKWVGREVNPDTFKEFGKRLITDVLKQMKNFVKNNPTIDFARCDNTFAVSSGGLQAIGEFNYYGHVEVTLNFIADTNFSIFNVEDLRNIPD